MTVLVSKIRLGAPDAMVLFGNSVAPVDLGASLAGAELDYTPTIFQVEIDQALMPFQVFKTKEEVSFTVSLSQFQMALVQSAFGYAQVLTTTAAAALVTPAAPTVTPTGGAAVTWSYKIIAVSTAGDSVPSAVGSTAAGAANLDTTHFNTITWTAQTTDAVYAYKIERTVVGTSPSTVGIIYTTYIGVAKGQALSFVDNGVAAVAYTEIVANPTGPNVDKGFVGGGNSVGGPAFMQQGAFDWTVPKSDGTSLHIRGHFNNVASYKAIKIDFKKEKVTEMAKIALLALADVTQPLGQQAGFMIEER